MIPVTRASKNALQHSDPLPRLVRGFYLLSAYEKSLLLWEKVAAEG